MKIYSDPNFSSLYQARLSDLMTAPEYETKPREFICRGNADVPGLKMLHEAEIDNLKNETFKTDLVKRLKNLIESENLKVNGEAITLLKKDH